MCTRDKLLKLMGNPLTQCSLVAIDLLQNLARCTSHTRGARVTQQVKRCSTDNCDRGKMTEEKKKEKKKICEGKENRLYIRCEMKRWIFNVFIRCFSFSSSDFRRFSLEMFRLVRSVFFGVFFFTIFDWSWEKISFMIFRLVMSMCSCRLVESFFPPMNDKWTPNRVKERKIKNIWQSWRCWRDHYSCEMRCVWSVHTVVNKPQHNYHWKKNESRNVFSLNLLHSSESLGAFFVFKYIECRKIHDEKERKLSRASARSSRHARVEQEWERESHSS